MATVPEVHNATLLACVILSEVSMLNLTWNLDTMIEVKLGEINRCKWTMKAFGGVSSFQKR